MADGETEAHDLHSRPRFLHLADDLFPPNSLQHKLLHSSWVNFVVRQGPTNASVAVWLQLYRNATKRQRAQLMKLNGGEINPRIDDANLLLSTTEAARTLGMAAETVRAYVDRGRLPSTLQPVTASEDRYHRRRYISAESLAEFQAERATLMSVSQTADYCGIHPMHIDSLLDSRALRAAHGPGIDMEPNWSFRCKDVDAFLHALLGPLPTRRIEESEREPEIPMRGGNRPARISLSRMLYAASWRSLTLTQILMAILNGELPALREQGENSWRIDGLWFERNHLQIWLSETCRARIDDTAVYSQQETATLLGCRKTKLAQLRDNGELVPIKTERRGNMIYYLYSSVDIQNYRDRYLKPEQVAEIIGLSRITVVRWAREGRLPVAALPALDGTSHIYRFDRAEIEKWRYERLTTREALDILGVSRTVLDARAAKGLITPLEGMGNAGVQRWWARVDLLHLKNVLDKNGDTN